MTGFTHLSLFLSLLVSVQFREQTLIVQKKLTVPSENGESLHEAQTCFSTSESQVELRPLARNWLFLETSICLLAHQSRYRWDYVYSIALSLSLSPHTVLCCRWSESTITVQPSAHLTYIYDWLTAVTLSCFHDCLCVCFCTFILSLAARNSARDSLEVTCRGCHENVKLLWIILALRSALCYEVWLKTLF